MKRRLLRHPHSPSSPVSEIQADAVRLADGRVSFVFMAIGDTRQVRIPEARDAVRADDLWRHTCFEAFVAPHDGEAYYEFNFAPSGAWAAYRLDSYRSGMTKPDIDPPDLKPMTTGSAFGMVVTVALGPIPELVPWQDWRIGLSAVIEAEGGDISYWALAHTPGKPDFHHRDCFAAELAPAATL
jgi:hypothetical protein